MANEFHFDTRALREHVLELREERAITQALRNSVQVMMNCGDPSLKPQYDHALVMIDKLEYYFQRMAYAMDEIDSETVVTYHRIRAALEESIAEMKIASHRFNI